MLTAAFIRKLEGLDAEGLRTLLSQLVGAEERARVRFSRTRSVKDGDRYARLRHEISEARMRLRSLPAVDPESTQNDA